MEIRVHSANRIASYADYTSGSSELLIVGYPRGDVPSFPVCPLLLVIGSSTLLRPLFNSSVDLFSPVICVNRYPILDD